MERIRNLFLHKTRAGLFVLLLAALVWSGANALRLFAAPPTSIPPQYFVVVDQQCSSTTSCVDDQPGQKDITQLGRLDTPDGFLDFFWSFNPGSISGGNTYDACGLFDLDNDGFVNYAICGQATNQGGSPKVTPGYPKVYSCPSDNFATKCDPSTDITSTLAAGDLLAGDLLTLDPAVNLVTDTDPFPLTAHNDAPHDITMRIKIKKSALGNARFNDVCTYSSGQLTSDYSDCISNPGGGFLRIVKNTTGGDGTFTFEVNPVPVGQVGADCEPIAASCKSYQITTSNFTGNVGVGLSIGTTASVKEIVPMGWDFGTASCKLDDNTPTGTTTNPVNNIQIVSGGVTTCTFTNNQKPAKLTVTKALPNDNGGTAVVGDFTLKVGNTTVSSGQENTFPPATYTVSESGGPSGYTPSFSGDCNANGQITLAPGGTYACTITNDDNAPSLILIKSVNTQQWGGSASPAAWNLSATCTTAGTCGSDVLSGAGGASSTASFKAGTYTLTEGGGPSGYTASSWSCTGTGTQNGSNITLGLGQSAECTITNTSEPGHLTIRKVVVNDNGGTKHATDFKFKVNGGTATSFTQSTDQNHGENSVNLSAGTFTVVEDGLPIAGYNTSTSGDCSGTVANGETKICTITNNDAAPGLTLVKVVNNTNGNDAGNKSASDFTLSANGSTPFSGAGPIVSSGASFSAGTYTLSESALPGYTASAWSCVKNGGPAVNGSTITMTPADSATCTITNTAGNILPVISVVKDVSPKNLTQDGGTATFSVTVTNLSGPYDPFVLTALNDDVYGNLAVDVEAGFKTQYNNTCGPFPKTLLSGESYSCHWTFDFPAIGPNETFSERDVVTVSGHDDENSWYYGHDDAVIVQSPPIAITNSSLCTFDTNPAPGRQFNRLFTQQDAYFGLTATNPGQFFYNLSLSGTPGSKKKITIVLPWPFVTQGNMPIHVYDSVGLSYNPDGTFCFQPGNTTDSIAKYVVLADYGVKPDKPSGYPPTTNPAATRKVEVEITIPASGFAYVNQHLDDGLKGPKVDLDGNGVLDILRYNPDKGLNATDPVTGTIWIPQLFTHVFQLFSGWISDGGAILLGDPSIQNYNEFKKNPGVAGIITGVGDAPIAGQTVQLKLGGTVVGTAISDSDGYYQIVYKYTGKATDFTVQLVAPFVAPAVSTSKPVTLKSNGFVVVNFQFP
jgi:prealbumin domain-containing protein